MEQERWIDERQVSEITGIAVQTLRKWRCKKVGIPYHKKGRMIRYRLSAVYKFMGQEIEVDPV